MPDDLPITVRATIVGGQIRALGEETSGRGASLDVVSDERPALVLVIEGVLYAGFPTVMRRALEAAMAMPDATLRAAGLLAAAIGVVVLWLIRG